MVDAIQQAINRALGRDPGPEHDEIDDVLAEYTSQHPSERLARQRMRQGGSTRRRRATSLSVMSDDGMILAVQSQLSETERLVVAGDGVSLEILEDVEEDEEMPGEVTILRD